MQGVGLSNNDLGGWDFRGQDLTIARLNYSTLTDADLSGTIVKGASFVGTTSRGFARGQLESTASYQTKDLQGIQLLDNDLTGWDFREQNLTNARLGYTTLTNANFAGAVVIGADFSKRWDGLGSGITQQQLASTASYRAQNLQRVVLGGIDLSGWDFGGQNMTGAHLEGSTLANANMTSAIVTGSFLGDTTSYGFTKEQLYATASWQAKNLRDVNLNFNDLTGWDFSGQNLINASMTGSILTNATFREATIAGANFSKGWDGGDGGLTQAQLESTASYQSKKLTGIGLANYELSGWDLNGQCLINAQLNGSALINTNLMEADLRGSTGAFLSGASLANAIRPNGSIHGLELADGQSLVVRDDDGIVAPYPWLPSRSPIAIMIDGQMTIAERGGLQLIFESDPWDSLISFEPGIPVQLGGTLELTFADDVDVATQVGRTIHLFDWTGVLPTGAFTVASQYPWDVSQLYDMLGNFRTGQWLNLVGLGGTRRRWG